MKLRNFLKIKYHQLFLLQRRILEANRLRNKMRRKIRNLSQVYEIKKDKKYINDVKLFLKENFQSYRNIDTHLYYSSLNGIKDVKYIPRDIFYTRIEPILNKTTLTAGMVDKINYDLFFNSSELPETLFKVINGDFYNKTQKFVTKEDAIFALSNLECDLVLKPAIDSGGGKGVIIKDAKNIASILTGNDKYMKGSYVIQKKLEQHHEMAKFHPTSLNTCRIMTARRENEIVVLGSYMRMGVNNSRIDNGSAGGIACGINENGNISEYSYDENANRYKSHPNSGIIFKGSTIPNFKDALNFCINNHKKFLRFTFISWDIAIDKNGKPIFIEFNLEKQSIDWHQYFIGSIFGQHTQYFFNKYNEKRINGSNHL